MGKILHYTFSPTIVVYLFADIFSYLPIHFNHFGIYSSDSSRFGLLDNRYNIFKTTIVIDNIFHDFYFSVTFDHVCFNSAYFQAMLIIISMSFCFFVFLWLFII